MTVNVELFGQLAPELPRRLSLNLERQRTVEEIVSMLGLNAEEIGMVAIDGIQSELQDLVPLECRLAFFSYLTGGSI